MSIWPARLSVKGTSKLMSWFSPTFSGALVKPTLVWRCCLKVLLKNKWFSRGVLVNTARFLRISSLETLRFLAPEGITDFGTALAKHCNHDFCSFVLQINWLKRFLTDHATACAVNGLASIYTFLMWHKDSSYRKKNAFPPYVTLYDETKSRSSARLPVDLGWAINFARGPLRRPRWRRAVPS